MTLLGTPGSRQVDLGLVTTLASRVGEELARDRIERGSAGLAALGADDERQYARRLVARHLDTLAAASLSAGTDPLLADEEHALASAVLDAVLGMGRIQPLLDDPDISDIHIRGCDSVWLKLRDGSRVRSGPVAGSDDELVELVRRIAARSGKAERRLDAATPELNLQLPDGSRLFAAIEVSARPSVVIRRHRFELSRLDELEQRGMFDADVGAFLAAAVRARRNLVISGGTGSGKTTLLRALINEIPFEERIVTIEDAYELGIDRFNDLHPDHDMLQSRPANIEGKGEITLLDLARMALRMDPDRVVIGEVRGSEASRWHCTPRRVGRRQLGRHAWHAATAPASGSNQDVVQGTAGVVTARASSSASTDRREDARGRSASARNTHHPQPSGRERGRGRRSADGYRASARRGARSQDRARRGRRYGHGDHLGRMLLLCVQRRFAVQRTRCLIPVLRDRARCAEDDRRGAQPERSSAAGRSPDLQRRHRRGHAGGTCRHRRGGRNRMMTQRTPEAES